MRPLSHKYAKMVLILKVDKFEGDELQWDETIIKLTSGSEG